MSNRLRLALVGLALLTVASLVACRQLGSPGDGARPIAHAAPLAQSAASKQSAALALARVELYFGTSSADGSGVSEQEWNDFEEQVLARQLAGYTEYPARGVWLDPASGKTVREGTHVVVHVYDPAHSSSVRAAVREITAAYERRYAQQSVLVVWSAAEVEYQ